MSESSTPIYISPVLPPELWLKVIELLAYELERLGAYWYEPFIPWGSAFEEQRRAARRILVSVALVSRQFRGIVLLFLQESTLDVGREYLSLFNEEQPTSFSRTQESLLLIT